MNPYEPKDLKRLRRAVDGSRRTLAPFREKRLDLLRQYVGHYYGDNGSEQELPLNLISLMVQIYTRNMFPQAPQVLVGTAYADVKPIAANFELALNEVLKKLNYKSEVDMTIINALFGLGIMKIGWTKGGSVEIDAVPHDYGTPYAKAVDLDDWVHDTSARSWDECSFFGNRYRIPLDFAKGWEGFDKAEREKLVATGKGDYNETNNGDVKNLSKGEEPYSSDEYTDHVELYDIWLPRENMLVTYGCENGEKPLAAIPWSGPPQGPYHILSFLQVPNNVMPVPPVSHLYDMHCLVNSLMRKLSDQAKREKQVGLVRPGGDQDAERIRAANDGELVRCDDPNNVNELRYGGPDNATMMFMLQTKDMASWMSGNLDAIGGLSSQADTLGQEKLISQNASMQMREMQDRVVAFTRKTINALAWWLWSDRFTSIPITKTVAGTDVQIRTEFGRDDRVGEFLDYNIDISPYSARDVGPGEKLAALTQYVMQLGLPMLPAMQQEGFTISAEKLTRTYAKLANMPEIEDMLTFARPPQQTTPGPAMPAPQMAMPGKPPVTTRIEKRVSQAGAGRRPQDALMGMMLAGAAQPKEAAAAAS